MVLKAHFLLSMLKIVLLLNMEQFIFFDLR